MYFYNGISKCTNSNVAKIMFTDIIKKLILSSVILISYVIFTSFVHVLYHIVFTSFAK